MYETGTGRGSGGNVIAALASLVVPGLGQLAQGRIFAALLQLVVSGILWVLTFGLLGWFGHILAALDAAFWRGDDQVRSAKMDKLRCPHPELRRLR
jgi:TM2 domain-containing membrane protein YozV